MYFAEFCEHWKFSIGGRVRVYINDNSKPAYDMGLGSFFRIGYNWTLGGYEITELRTHFKKDGALYIIKLRG